MNLSRRAFQSNRRCAGNHDGVRAFLADQAFASESKQDWKLVNTEEYTNICCYCAGGCGSLLSVRDGELVNLEGDPDHPINEGGLCPKRYHVPAAQRGRPRDARSHQEPEAFDAPPGASSRRKRLGGYLLG